MSLPEKSLFFASFLHFLTGLLHQSIQMTTDLHSALNFLQKYFYQLHDIDDLDIVTGQKR